MSNNWIKDLFKYKLVVLMTILAAVALFTPLQKFMSLGRFQHYGIGLVVFGTGYFMQAIWSWRVTPLWTRVSHVATGLFFSSVGLVFYSNAWLDYRVNVQTADKEIFRNVLLAVYLFFAFLMISLWLKSLHSDRTVAPPSPTDKPKSES